MQKTYRQSFNVEKEARIVQAYVEYLKAGGLKSINYFDLVNEFDYSDEQIEAIMARLVLEGVVKENERFKG